jgi:hypothetical protein
MDTRKGVLLGHTSERHRQQGARYRAAQRRHWLAEPLSSGRCGVIEGCRLEALLDPVRATTLRSAIDQATSAWIREGQYDGENPLPEDVRTTEQINAHALVRMAEVFFRANARLRGAKFTSQVLFTIGPSNDDLAESVYGTQIPASVLPRPGDEGTHLLECDENGEPLVLDGVKIDADPTTRLASLEQRIALAFRDRHCTYPGCTRPPTWSLHAHHHTPHSQGGPTTMGNLTLLCAEHHALVHQLAA